MIVGGHRRVASDGSEKIFRDSSRFTPNPGSSSGSHQHGYADAGAREQTYFESTGKHFFKNL